MVGMDSQSVNRDVICQYLEEWYVINGKADINTNSFEKRMSSNAQRK
jgi:hypothetical protein